VSAGAGVELHAKPGGQLRAGMPLLTLHADEPERFTRALAALDGAYEIAEAGPPGQPLVLGRVG
jgi:thymidine phosphorylase